MRESFRPFAPIVVSDKQYEYFEMKSDIPYMNQISKKEEYYMFFL
jgi:predicted NodU family carbamoyl transferase